MKATLLLCSRPLVLSSCVIFNTYFHYLLTLGCETVFKDVVDPEASIIDLAT